MRLDYAFTLDLPPDAVRARLFAPQRYLAHFPQHAGLVRADDAWPAAGSSLVMRLRLLPGATLNLRHEVTRNEDGAVDVLETGLGGFWRDRYSWRLQPAAGGTSIALTTRPSLRFAVLQPLTWLSWPLYRFVVMAANRRLPALIADASAAPEAA